MKFLCITLVVLAAVIQSCRDSVSCDSEFRSVQEDVKQWIPYIEGDQIVFESSSGEDVLKVGAYTTGSSPYDAGSGCPKGQAESIRVYLVSQTFDDTLHFSLEGTNIGIYDGYEEYDMGMFYIDHDPARGLHVSKGTGTYRESLIVDGKTYTDIIHAQCENCGPLTEVILSRHIGVAAYKVDGVYWTR